MTRMMSGFGAASAGRILVAVIIVWILLIFFIGGPIFRRSTDSDLTGSNGETGTELILARLSRASSELKSLRAQNEELRKIIDHLIPLKSSSSSSSHLKSSPSDDHQLDHHETLSSSDHVLHSTVPNHSYEDSRRRLYSNINEEWFYLRKRLNVTDLKFLTQLRHNLLYDLDEISLRDKKWRTSEYQKLSGLMDSVIHKLQNPASCDKAPKLVCQLNKGCGFGCQIHHVVYCFVVALATDRTLILDAKNWRYVDHKTRKSKTAGWNLVFKQLSETCLDESGSSRSSWKSGDHTTQVLDLPIIDSLRPRPDFLPLAIPQQISDRIEKMHGLPIAWFLGHLTKYIMRLSPDMEAFVAEAKARFNFKRPIVGVHVRRTDKVGSEAAYHPLSEYMALVSDYYDQLDLYQERNGSDAKVERNVYLATDDPGIWRKETNKYEDKGFFFMGDSDIAQSAGIGTRYTTDSLRNIILDIWLLSQCDILVCTFSSQVCRVAYELMQTRIEPEIRLDWSQAFYSLDDIYYYGGQSDHSQQAIMKHVSTGVGDMDLNPGDIIGVAGNHWDGWSKGLNRRTNREGLYPSFKTIEKVQTSHFKAFDGV